MSEEVRDDKGRWLKAPEGQKITPASARSMAEKRWAKFRAAASRHVLTEAQAIDNGITTPADAWGFAVAKQYTALLDSDKPRGDDLHRIGQAIGAVPMPHELKETEGGGQAVVQAAAMNAVTAAVLAKVLEDVQRMQSRDVVDGTIAEERTDNG